jgi:hypothetical protein
MLQYPWYVGQDNMRVQIWSLIFCLFAAGSVRAASTAYAYCGTYSSYVLLYKSTDQLEELGKLRCGEKVEVITRWAEYFQVRTGDGRVGWVHYSEISNAAPQTGPSINFGLTDQAAKPRTDTTPALTNANILKMHGMRLGSDVIVAKIKASSCEFDTSPAALQKLKQAGIADKTILAMVEAPLASTPPAPKVPEAVQLKIPGGTPVELELKVNISSDAAQEGMIIPMSVVEDVVVNGVMVFPRGSEAQARVTTVKQPGFMGHPPGEISWTMEYVTAVTGDHIPANFFSKEAAANPVTAFTGSAGPSWEFRKGKPAVVAAGKRFQTVVHGDALLRIPQELAVSSAGHQAAGQPGPSASTPSNVQPTAPPVPQAAAQPGGKPWQHSRREVFHQQWATNFTFSLAFS